MLLRYLILFYFLSITQLFAQENMEILWQGCYGGTEPDEARGIIQVGTDYYVIGGTDSNDGDISYNHGSKDGWLIKMDSTGSLLWEKSYGGSFGDGLYQVFQTSDNNLYLIGGAFSSDGDISDDPYLDSSDLWIIKTDTSGNIIWDKIVGGNMVEYYTHSIITSNDDIILICSTASDDGDISLSFGSYDIWVVKVNSQGVIEWDYTLGGSTVDIGGRIIQTNDDGFIVTGGSMSNDGNINCIENNTIASNGVIAKLDENRNIEWVRCYGGSWGENIFDIIEISDGYVFSGYSYSNDGDVSGHHGIAGPPNEDGTADIWVVKIDFEGNIIWQNSIGGSEDEASWYITQTEDEGFIVIGKTKSHDGDVVGNHSYISHGDIWMVKLNALGEIVWQRCVGGIGDEEVERGILKKGDNHYIIAGETGVMDGDVLCDPWGPDMWPDYWVFDFKDTISGDGFDKYIHEGIKVYPNPAIEYVVFELEAFKENGTIKIMNLLGLEVAHLNVNAQKTVWDCRDIIPGIYFYHLKNQKSTFGGKILIQ